MTAYARTRPHPPIFTALHNVALPYGAVTDLARRLAYKDRFGTEPDPRGPEVDWKESQDETDRRNAWLGSIESDPSDFWGSPEGFYE